MRYRCHVAVISFLVAAAVAGLAAAASACVPQPLLAVEPRASGPAGTELTVSARDVPGMTSEIRWNGAEGPVLARAESKQDFSVSVTVPDVDPGLYALIVIGRSTEGGVAGTGRAAFLVTDGNGNSAPSAEPRTTGAREGTESSAVGLALGGAGLLVLGGIGGGFLTRRRRHDSDSESP